MLTLAISRFFALLRSYPQVVSSFLVFAISVLLTAHPALASSADISTYFGDSGSGEGLGGFFTTLLAWLTGPIAQIIAACLVIGAIWRLRNNFEWGEAGTTILMIVLGIGLLAFIPAIWNHFSTTKFGGSATYGSGFIF